MVVLVAFLTSGEASEESMTVGWNHVAVAGIYLSNDNVYETNRIEDTKYRQELCNA